MRLWIYGNNEGRIEIARMVVNRVVTVINALEKRKLNWLNDESKQQEKFG